MFRLADPLEQAFTVEVPSGWRSEAGLARRSTLQINAYVGSLSPDKMTYLMVGEPTMPGFVPPSQMGNAIRISRRQVLRFRLGWDHHGVARYAWSAIYGESALGGLCQSLRFSSVQDRPDLARKAAAWLPTVIPGRDAGGEARFTYPQYATNGRPRSGRHPNHSLSPRQVRRIALPTYAELPIGDWPAWEEKN